MITYPIKVNLKTVLTDTTAALRYTALFFLMLCLTACGGGGGGTSGFSDNNTGSTTPVAGTPISGTTTLRIGNGSGAGFTAGALAATQTSLAAGASTTITANLVNTNGVAITSPSQIVTFSSPCITSNTANLDNPSVTTTTGVASVVYTAAGCVGNDIVTASVVSGGTTLTATVTLTVSAAATIAVIGNGTGNNFVSGQLAASLTTLNPNLNPPTSSSVISLSLVDANNSNSLITSSQTVSFSSQCLTDGTATLNSNLITTTSGTASVNYAANGCVGNDIITARVGESGATATVTINHTASAIGEVRFISATPTQLSISGLGNGSQTSTVTFRVLNSSGLPVINQMVNFTLTSTSPNTGGARIAINRESGLSNASGDVSTVVQSGTLATSLQVIATHPTSQLQGSSIGIAVSTGRVVSDNFSISIGSNRPAQAFNTDGIAVTLGVIATDQFGNQVPDGTLISFITGEIGLISPSFCTTTNGQCSTTWLSSGIRPPDNRVTLLAFTPGIERFTDRNGNGVLEDSGADNATNPTDDRPIAFDDLPELYADDNENRTYDSGEPFRDINNNSTYDANGDGFWNGPCLQEGYPNAVCSSNMVGVPETIFVGRQIIIAMPLNRVTTAVLGTFPNPSGPITAIGTGTTFSGLFLSDGNLGVNSNNILSSPSSTDTCTTTVGTAYMGNPLPFGTTLAFSSTGADITNSLTAITLNTNNLCADGPTGGFNLTLGNVTSTNVRLELLVTFPNNTTETITWLFTGTPPDTTPPTISIAVIAGNNEIDTTEDDNDIIIAGTSNAENGRMVTVGLNGVNYTGTVNNGAWSVTVPALDAQALPAATTVTADVTDVSGNAATQAVRFLTHILPDTTPPTISIAVIAGNDDINATEDDNDIVISGLSNAENGQTVTVGLNGVNYTGPVNNGAWSVTVPALNVQALPAATTVTADVADAAGNAATQATRPITHTP